MNQARNESDGHTSLRTAAASVLSIVLTVGVVQIANGLQTDLISVRASLAAFSPSVIGLVMSSYYVGYCVAPLVSHAVIARFGHVAVILGGCLLAASVIALHPFVIAPLAWALLRALSGFVLSLLYVAAESWIHGRVANAVRGQVFSFYMLVQMTAMSGAQGLFALSSPLNVAPFLLASALFVAALVPVLVADARPPRDAPPEPLGIVRLFRLSALGAIVTMISGASWSIVFTFGPVYARHAGFSVGGIALFMAFAMVGGALFQVPLGWISDRWDRRWTLMAMSAGGGAAALFGLFADRHGSVAKEAASLLVGGLIFTLYAIAAARVNDAVAQPNRVAAAAGLVLLFGLGSIVGPLLCGYAMGSLGNGGYFLVLFATSIASLAATIVYR